jgi:NAD(P)-dependent dehydrogenase (short-subunit alcohol dehydrogenase family)
MESDEWDMTYNCNLKPIFLFTKYSIDLLKKSKGNIINIGSVHSVSTSSNIAAYASSKAAIVGLTKNLAIELGKFNIRVNCVSPGAIDTKMLRSGLNRDNIDMYSEEDLLHNIEKLHLLKKIGKPKDIANCVYFILDNEFINGSNIIIDGGATIKLSTE